MRDQKVVDELLDPEKSPKNAVEPENTNSLTEEQLAAVANYKDELYSGAEDEQSASEDDIGLAEDDQGLAEEESFHSVEEGGGVIDGDDDSVGDKNEDYDGSPKENDVDNKEDDGVVDDDGSISSVGEESAGPKELVDFVKGKFPRSKVDGLKFLVDYQNKNKAALRGTVLEVPIKVDVWNAKYLLREMRDIYNKVVPSVIIFNKKLIEAHGRKLAKKKRTPATNVTNVSTNVKSSNKCNNICTLTKTSKILFTNVIIYLNTIRSIIKVQQKYMLKEILNL